MITWWSVSDLPEHRVALVSVQGTSSALRDVYRPKSRSSSQIRRSSLRRSEGRSGKGPKTPREPLLRSKCRYGGGQTPGQTGHRTRLRALGDPPVATERTRSTPRTVAGTRIANGHQTLTKTAIVSAARPKASGTAIQPAFAARALGILRDRRTHASPANLSSCSLSAKIRGDRQAAINWAAHTAPLGGRFDDTRGNQSPL